MGPTCAERFASPRVFFFFFLFFKQNNIYINRIYIYIYIIRRLVRGNQSDSREANQVGGYSPAQPCRQKSPAPPVMLTQDS